MADCEDKCFEKLYNPNQYGIKRFFSGAGGNGSSSVGWSKSHAGMWMAAFWGAEPEVGNVYSVVVGPQHDIDWPFEFFESLFGYVAILSYSS
jgi:hypothetical protein